MASALTGALVALVLFLFLKSECLCDNGRVILSTQFSEVDASVSWAWPSTSLPGEPNGMTKPPGAIASTGLAAILGRRPGPTQAGCVESVAPRGFVATRRGKRIEIEGIIEHRWDDRYDFEEGRPSSEAPLMLLQAGRAHVYETKSGWKQRFVGTVDIEEGRLVRPRFQWQDIDA
jgi:hypothetical protein